ncbi:MAG: hypothetical protein HFH93_04600 [Lachnospiraceae bacterium]|nr:hypothetical protein [Lachnospiraceae bacterium]
MKKPDSPIPFGYKTSWLCVKAQDSLDALRVLGLKNPQEANWESGIQALEQGKVFVSPVISGYILVIGYEGNQIGTLPEDPRELCELGKLFPQVQYYASHRVAEYAAWAKFEEGELIRAYAWCGDQGEVLINEGIVTPQEEQIGMGNPLADPLGTDDWDAFDVPDEESVVELAALWGVDPLFRGEYPKSTGFVCDR